MCVSYFVHQGDLVVGGDSPSSVLVATGSGSFAHSVRRNLYLLGRPRPTKSTSDFLYSDPDIVQGIIWEQL